MFLHTSTHKQCCCRNSMMLSFSLCLVTDVSAEHLPAVVSCCSIDQAVQLGQKQQFPGRQQSLSILLVSCKTDQSRSILSCPLGNKRQGCCCIHPMKAITKIWAARYNTWLLIKFHAEGCSLFFSFLFFSITKKL